MHVYIVNSRRMWEVKCVVYVLQILAKDFA